MESLCFHQFDKAVIVYSLIRKQDKVMSVKMIGASSGPIAPRFLQPGCSREWKGRTICRLTLGKCRGGANRLRHKHQQQSCTSGVGNGCCTSKAVSRLLGGFSRMKISVLQRKKGSHMFLSKPNRCLDVVSVFFRECRVTDLSAATLYNTLQRLIANQFLGCSLVKVSSMIQLNNQKIVIK